MSEKETVDKKETDDPVNTELHAVFYTDGGCMQKPGYGGWGYHGYVYVDDKPKKGSGCKTAEPGPKGYVPKKDKPEIQLNKYLDGWGSVTSDYTNNLAEMDGLDYAINKTLTLGVDSVRFLLDSRYVLDGATKHLENWKSNDWVTSKGTEVKNKDGWLRLDSTLQRLEDSGINASWGWVKGHSGDTGNDKADKNATRGVSMAGSGETVIKESEKEPDGYWNKKAEINRMFSQSRWYFNSGIGKMKSHCDRSVYHTGFHGKDDELLGKRMSDVSFSVLFLKEEEPLLEIVREKQDSLEKGNMSSIVVGRLDTLLNSTSYAELLEEGDSSYVKRGRTNNLFTLDKQPVTTIMNPPYLAYNAVDAMSAMEDTLKTFIENPEHNSFVVTELTDKLYDIGEKGKKVTCKLKAEIDNTVKSITVDAKYKIDGTLKTTDLILTVGMDLPKRNTLSALAGRVPKVYLLTWRESDTAFRYATIVEAGDDVGIWCSVYSNLRC